MKSYEKALHIDFKKSSRQVRVYAVIDFLITAGSPAEAKTMVEQALKEASEHLVGATTATIGTRQSEGAKKNGKVKRAKAVNAEKKRTRVKPEEIKSVKDQIIALYKTKMPVDEIVKKINNGQNFTMSKNTIYRYLRLWKVIPPLAAIPDDDDE